MFNKYFKHCVLSSAMELVLAVDGYKQSLVKMLRISDCWMSNPRTLTSPILCLGVPCRLGGRKKELDDRQVSSKMLS